MTLFENDLLFEDSWTYEDLVAVQTTGSICGDGWIFFTRNPAGRLMQVYPSVDGEMSFDITRDIRRSISGQIMLPSEIAKFDKVSQELYCFLVKATDVYPMGVFILSELNEQPNTIIDPDSRESSSLITVAWADRMMRLRANDGTSLTIVQGSDPAQSMLDLLTSAGIPASVAGAVSNLSAPLLFDGSSTLYDRVSQLAELAGHRPPWPDNNGTIRSVLGAVEPTSVIDLMDLKPVAGSIMSSNNYIGAPNRVIVTDNSGNTVGVRGQWDAPASAPHSFQNRGWVQTEMVSVQGLTTSAHAEQVARTIGEAYLARTLNFELAVPTPLLDGPVFLSYKNRLWIVESWSISLSSGATMSVTAQEFTTDVAANDVGRALV